jgi:acyl-coenzyme A thioesterase PaaI-like protein
MVYFKLLDDSAFFAVNSIVEDVFVLTTSFNINLIRPANEGIITAVGKLKFKSRELFVAESILYNEAGNEIAFGTGNFAKSKITLSEDIGYKL